MIFGKPKFAGLEGDALRDAQLEDLTRRLDLWEETQYNAWSFAADAKGDELTARMARVEELVARLEGVVSGVPEAFVEQAELVRLQETQKYLLAANFELSERLGEALTLIESLASVVGFARWDGDGATWEAWKAHVNGSKPKE